jgi:DNA sulfur modification protein DndC
MAEQKPDSRSPLGPLTITGESLNDLEELTRATYLADSRPWVIGYSGGKDSTVITQLIWMALSKLPADKLTKPIHVISGDTLVEAPAIVQRIERTHKRIREAAESTGMPFQTHVVRPTLGDTFWVNLLGKGYPAPYRRFRWCTDRMKIQPANLFIKETVAQFGEVMLVLGVRRAESATRAQSMSLRQRFSEKVSRHSDLPSAWVYTPIEDWTTNDVWTYLMQAQSPWGDNNRDLVALYRSANEGECPLVVDTNTPSCGNSRFGCWVCTVVSQDHSMVAQIENGAEWMRPMLEFRDYLAKTADPKRKREIRDVRRRDGQVHLYGKKHKRCPLCPRDGFLEGKTCKECTKKTGRPVFLINTGKETKDKLVHGPFKLEFRREMLGELLRAQKQVNEQWPEDEPGKPEFLISIGELKEIRRLWRVESGDWADSVPPIWNEVFPNDPIEWGADDVATGTHGESLLLDEVANEHNLEPRLLRELIDFERRTIGFHRRRNLNAELQKILKKDWRSEEEVYAALPQISDDEVEHEELQEEEFKEFEEPNAP